MAKKEVTYAEAMGEIEKILARLRNEEMDVDSLAAEVKRATELIASCKARLRKAEAEGIEAVPYAAVETGEKETALIQALAEFPEVVRAAGQTYSPALIANYAYDTVKLYNSFYHDCPVLSEPDAARRSLRLALSRATADTVRTAMGLLGIEVPERM